MAEEMPHTPLPADFNQTSLFLRERRKAETKGGSIEERTQKLLAVIGEGHLEKWKNASIPVSLGIDPNGLRIDAGPKSDSGIHSHIPFSYIAVDLIPHLLQAGLSEHAALEVKIQHARATHDDQNLAALVGEQEAKVAQIIQGNHVYEALNDPHERAREAVCNYIATQFSYVKRSIDFREEPLHFSVEILQDLFQQKGTENHRDPHYAKVARGQRIMNVLDIAESYNKSPHEKDPLSETSQEGWNDIRQSHKPSQLNKDIFEKRSSGLKSAHNYESAKILNSLFESVSVDNMHESGIRIVRGTYKDGLEFVGFWRDGAYTRVLHDPRITFQSASSKRMYDEIPRIPRAQFESFEALILPFKYFKVFSQIALYPFFKSFPYENELKVIHADDPGLPEAKAATENLLRIAVSDLRIFHRELLDAYDNLFGPNASVTEDTVRKFVDTVRNVHDAYSATIDGREAMEIIAEKAPIPHVRTVTFDQKYIESIPSVMKDPLRLKFDEAMSTSQRKIRVVESGPHGIHYANEGRAMRALGILPAPTIVVTGGAAHLVRGSSEWIETENAMRDILSVAFETKANILIPGTQSGIGILFPKIYWERFDALSKEEQALAPKMFAVEPGKELFYPDNPILDLREGTSPWALTAADTITTPYHAGWTKHGSESEYRQHILYRQALIQRASEGHHVVNVVLNGGAWTILEENEALQDNMAVLIRENTGRFANMALLALTHKEKWGPLPEEEQVTFFKELAQTLPSESDRVSVENAFSNKLYRNEFLRFMKLGRFGVDQNVFSGNTASFADMLRGLLGAANPQ